MKTSIFSTLCLFLGACIWSCTPERGCTELTADNYDISAEEDDGTCIPARDKLIGNYTYSNFWTDVVTGFDTIEFGTIQITEANTAGNAYNTNFDGQLFLQGSVSAYDLIFEYHVMGTSTYTGTGSWLTSDTVDMVLNISYNDPFLPVPQPFTYYCTKTN